MSSKIVKGEQADKGRDVLEEMVRDLPGTVEAYQVVRDVREDVRAALISLCDQRTSDVLLTVGGTGIRPTDWTPEATRDVIEKEIPGVGEAMRQESLRKMKTAMLSRGTAGIRGRTLIINLPGSPNGVRENLGVVLPILGHMVEKIAGPSVG